MGRLYVRISREACGSHEVFKLEQTFFRQGEYTRVVCCPTLRRPS